jgi:DmsE family decaheme c-type cytochrome
MAPYKRYAVPLSIVVLIAALSWAVSRSKVYANASTAEKVGASACAACHQSEVEEFKKNIHAKTFPAVKKIPFEESCETCHGPGSLHVNAGGDKSNPDFASIQSLKKLSPSDAAAVCLQCHEKGKQMFWKGSVHESRDVSCLECHSIHHSGAGKNLLAKVSEIETCLQCHNLKKAQMMRTSHMPLREGKMKCTDCHNPHGSPGPKLLAQNSVNENCYACHAEKRGPFLWEHAPVRENCLNCHEPHGSQHDRLLKVKRPRLCQECHIEARHPTTGSTPDDIHISARSCTECHSAVHGSNHPSGARLMR